MKDKLWAPWRKKYILHKKAKGCFICRIFKAWRDKANYIVTRSKHSFAVLNIYPYNNGHILVVPNRHIKDLGALRDYELLDVMKLTNEMMARLRKKMRPHGFNLGINLGRVAGAGVPGHVHLHIVPRYKGDGNFMPVIANTKVISESLKSVYQKLSKCEGGGFGK
jgi:ATP adenylyltransferase